MTRHLLISTPLGTVLAVREDRGLSALGFSEAGEAPGQEAPGDPVLAAAKEWLSDYFQGRAPDPAGIPLSLTGTPFQRCIWELLTEIPYGNATTYGALAAQAARRLGKSTMSAQAVGQAVGKNPVSIIVPCHRVLGAGGTLTGYAWGLDRKAALLTLEGIPYRTI